MSEQVAKGHRVLGIFTLNLEVSQIVIDAVVKLEFALLHLL